jgi:hypothetical protein
MKVIGSILKVLVQIGLVLSALALFVIVMATIDMYKDCNERTGMVCYPVFIPDLSTATPAQKLEYVLGEFSK